MLEPHNIDDLQECLQGHKRILPVGGGTKPALSTPPRADTAQVSMKHLSGVLEYEPSEFTFTALAGTPISTVSEMLAAHGQYLPFDPPFTAQGATLGGTVAAALNGPGSYRYGGIRDFILGVRIMDGAGQSIRAGGKVVKNAAGFDLPKFMVGSLGRFGVLTEITFKVFPRAEGSLTFAVAVENLDEAVKTMTSLANGSWDIDALELEPNEYPNLVCVRICGHQAALAPRAKRMGHSLGREIQIFDENVAAFYWSRRNGFTWTKADASIIKIPTTPSTLVSLERACSPGDNTRVYSVGGNVAYVSGEIPEAALEKHELPALTLRGKQVFASIPTALMARIKQTLDPNDRFPGLAAA